MSGNLEQLLEDGVIDEVLSRLKSGKEADVWLVRHREEVLAAKVYKERSLRSFKNNSGYKEGRTVRNTRTQRAMDRGSRFGQEAAEEEWKSAESDALHKLHAQGVRVPAPVLFYEGILLMKLVLDTEGQPAPRLIDVAFEPAAAAEAYADLRAQAVRMLCSDLIHGDLSAYNVLMAAEGPTIIDFPQVISAAQNSTAAEFFQRDIENLRTFFAGFDPALAARNGDAPEIWQAYVRRELSPEFVPSGRPLRESPPPRRAEAKPEQASHSRQPHGGSGPPHGSRPQEGARPHHGARTQHGGRPKDGARAQHGERPHHTKTLGERPERNRPVPERGPQGAPARPQHAAPAQQGNRPHARSQQRPQQNAQARPQQGAPVRTQQSAPSRPLHGHSPRGDPGQSRPSSHALKPGASPGAQAPRPSPSPPGARSPQPGTPSRPRHPQRTAPIIERIQRPVLPGARPVQPPSRRPPRH